MTDILTKSFLQAQSGASNGLYQDLTVRPSFQQINSEAAQEGAVEAVEQSKQLISGSGAMGAESNMSRRDGKERQDKQKSNFTVMIKDSSGEQRVLSVRAETADGAKNAARATLADGDELVSVNESTVPSAPNPNRGVVA